MKFNPPIGKEHLGDYAHYEDANNAAGTIGDITPAIAVESPQREIVKAIAEAGLVPSSTDNTQLSQAITLRINKAIEDNKNSMSGTAPLVVADNKFSISLDNKSIKNNEAGALGVVLVPNGPVRVTDTNKLNIAVDGVTITLDENNQLKALIKNNTAALATPSTTGTVRPDGTTIVVDGNGIISMYQTTFTSTGAPAGGKHGDIWYQTLT